MKLDGSLTEPPVSPPSAKSHSPPATAAADPLEEPPLKRPAAFGLIVAAVVRVDAVDAEGDLVSLRFPDNAGARRQQPFNYHRSFRRHRMRLQPIGIAERGTNARDVINVLNAEGQAGEWSLLCPGDLNVRVPAESIQLIPLENGWHDDDLQCSSELCGHRRLGRQ